MRLPTFYAILLVCVCSCTCFNAMACPASSIRAGQSNSVQASDVLNNVGAGCGDGTLASQHPVFGRSDGSAPPSPSHHDTVSHNNTASPPTRTPSPPGSPGSRPAIPPARPQVAPSSSTAQVPKYDNPASRKRLREQVAGNDKPIFRSTDLRWMKKLNYQPAPKPFELHTPSPSSSLSSHYPPASPAPSSPSDSFSSVTPPGSPTVSQSKGKKARVVSPASSSSSHSNAAGPSGRKRL
ncbi:unnamed protein product [Sympodiomycopsis kandeliae]